MYWRVPVWPAGVVLFVKPVGTDPPQMVCASFISPPLVGLEHNVQVSVTVAALYLIFNFCVLKIISVLSGSPVNVPETLVAETMMNTSPSTGV